MSGPQCDLFECEYSTNVETNFKAHLSAQHKQGEQCEQCDFVAASKTKLEQHRDLHGSFPCDECNHVATLQKDIKMHKFTFHTIRDNFMDIKINVIEFLFDDFLVFIKKKLP